MSGGKGSKAPDYGPIAELGRESAEMQTALGREQLDWQKQMWAEQKSLLDSIITKDIELSDEMLANAREDRLRYEELYQPMEEDYLKQAAEWDTPAKRRQAMAQAQADVYTNVEAARQAALRELETFGVDPSHRYQALDLNTRVQGAIAAAQAGTSAANQRELQGLGLKGESINVGRGLPAQGLQHASLGLQAQNQAMGAAGQWQNAAGLANQTAATMAQGINSGASIWGNALTAQMNANEAQRLGGWTEFGKQAALAGGAAWLGAAEGGEVRGPGGPREDAIPLRVSDGEYVVPANVVARKGTEFFDKLVNKVNEEEMQRIDQAQVSRHALALPPAAAITNQGGSA